MTSFLKTLIVCLFVLTAASGVAYEYTEYEYTEFEFPERRPDNPDAPTFKNPIFNGDFFGMPTDLFSPVSIYPDGPVDPRGIHDYGQCTLIINEPDEVAFKCLNKAGWRTLYFVNIDVRELYPDDDADSDDDHPCIILKKSCTASTCYDGFGYSSNLYYKDCGPGAPRDKWEDPVELRSTNPYYESDLKKRDHQRDLLIRKQFNIPD